MHRRNFLASAAVLLAAPKSTLADDRQKTLLAGAFSQQILPTRYAGPTAVLGFNGAIPGPELRVQQGETLSVRLENGLDQGTAVHWHGVRLDNAMDGVPSMTQPLVEAGASFDYHFRLPDAGTYWYHSHYVSNEQVARGLIGPLIVEEAQAPDVDHDLPVVLTDWKLDPEGQLTDDFGNTHDVAHAGRMGNFAKAFLPQVGLRQGERVRLRLINAAANRIFPVILKGLDGKVVALDGMPLAAPRTVEIPVLAPAQRMDLIADVTGPVVLEMDHPNGPYPLGEIAVSGTAERRAGAIHALPPNDVPTPATPVRTLTLAMKGGAMGGAHGGGNIWSFNDISDMPSQPFGRFGRGETVRISLVNETRWPHGIHLHGHHFFELGVDGTPGDFRDTTLINPRETRDILCHFDNPGNWMLHCHMLSHQTGGMKTWVEVA
jgi:FtsP/CotA-like multicopper oxidase with cupredoxin domain